MSFPTVTRCYECAYPSGDQIRERGKNISAMTDGETFSNPWMDDLIYTTAIHAGHYLCANGNLDGWDGCWSSSVLKSPTTLFAGC
jgi:hypothetical protein